MCAGMKEEAQAHYFSTILAIPIKVLEYPEYRLPKKKAFFSVLSKPKRPDRISFILLSWLHYRAKGIIISKLRNLE